MLALKATIGSRRSLGDSSQLLRFNWNANTSTENLFFELDFKIKREELNKLSFELPDRLLFKSF